MLKCRLEKKQIKKDIEKLIKTQINNIKQQSETILELLKHKFDVVKPDGSLDTAAISDEEGKEDSHE